MGNGKSNLKGKFLIQRIFMKMNKNRVFREYLNVLGGVIKLYILVNSKIIKELECGMFTPKMFLLVVETMIKKDQSLENGRIEKIIDQDKIYVGEFKQGIRIGRWSIWYKSHHIGGGGYDNNGLKQGYWIDPEKDYYEYLLFLNLDQPNYTQRNLQRQQKNRKMVNIFSKS